MNTTAFLKAKDYIQAQTKVQLELTQLDAIMRIYKAGEKGISVSDISQQTGVSNSAAGRTAATLSTQGYKGTKQAGWGLAQTFIDYDYPKYKMVKITDKGKEVVEKFLALLVE